MKINFDDIDIEEYDEIYFEDIKPLETPDYYKQFDGEYVRIKESSDFFKESKYDDNGNVIYPIVKFVSNIVGNLDIGLYIFCLYYGDEKYQRLYRSIDLQIVRNYNKDDLF